MSDKTVARVELWIWILLYGGLLALVFGLAVERRLAPLGWSIVVGGGIAAATGILLIVVRSRMKADNSQRT